MFTIEVFFGNILIKNMQGKIVTLYCSENNQIFELESEIIDIKKLIDIFNKNN